MRTSCARQSRSLGKGERRGAALTGIVLYTPPATRACRYLQLCAWIRLDEVAGARRETVFSVDFPANDAPFHAHSQSALNQPEPRHRLSGN
jgi:hypothetical protein